MTALKKLTFFLMITAIFVCSPYFANKYFFSENPIIVSFERNPSSIQKVYDYSDLVGSALQTAAKQRLVDTIQLSAKGGDIYIQMGNFVLMNDSRQKDFACGYYNKMSFEFEADGVLVEGEKPLLTIETGCDVASNINFMAPFKIPVSSLKAQKPSQTDYKFFDQGHSTTISLNHSPTSWPTVWNLKNIKMSHNSISSRLLRVPTLEAAQGSKISMKW